MHQLYSVFRRGGTSILCVFLALSASGCSRSTRPERLAICGEIVFGGEPLASGRIVLSPIDNTNGPTAVATVTDGLYTFDRQNGPIAGTYRIQIQSIPELAFELDDEAAYANAIRHNQGRPVLPPESIPPEYNKHSTLIATIGADGEFEYDFALNKSIARRGR